MKKLTKEEVNNMSSEDAYRYCLNVVEDREEVRNKITESKWAYWYCLNIKDREEIWKRITESNWAYFYCKYIKDREEVRKHIKN